MADLPFDELPASGLPAALRRLDPSERELLELSLRRRIPDESLAELLDIDRATVAGRRAQAIGRFADELGVERGEQLGRALVALLDEATWELLDGANPPRAAVTAPRPDKRRGALRAALRCGSVRAAVGAAGALSLAAGLIAGRDAEPDPATADAARAPEPSAVRSFVPSWDQPAPFPTARRSGATYAAVRVERGVVLRERPGGRRVGRLRARTEFGSPVVLSVVRRRGGWLGVHAPQLPNRRIGWIPASSGRAASVAYSIHVDRSRRQLVVRRGGKALRRMTVTVGRLANPTPTGRFAVTDRLRVSDPRSPYGCCILALTGRQPTLPPDWPGGDRLAVHASRDPRRALGGARSLGCLRADPRQARWLVGTVPLGTPVFIQP